MRRARLPVLACLLAAFAGPSLDPGPGAAAGGPAAVSRHDLAVTLRLAEGTLSGTDTLTVEPRGAAEATLLLSPGARVASVTAKGKPVPFAFRHGTLSIRIPAESRDGTFEPTVAYEAEFRDPLPRDPVNFEDPGFGVSGSISPAGVFLDAAARWYPAAPEGRSTFRVAVSAGKGVEAVTAGALVRRATRGDTTVSEWEVREPLEGIALSAGRYVVRERRDGNVTLYTYFFPENDALSVKYLAGAARFLELYRGLLGPYPFEKFAVVENFFPTGYGFPSYTLLGSSVVRLPFIVDTSLGHEIAHSWWGNGVSVDLRRGNWSEGLTTYVADYLYKERESPAEGREYRLRLLREYATLVSPKTDVALKEFAGRSNPATRAVGYGKAAMVFHMARRMVGDEAFWRALRDVVREKMFRSATWGDFERALGREGHVDVLSFRDGSVDFAAFFRQWVDRPGAPVLSLADVRATRAGTGWKIAGTLVQEKPYYELDVPVRLETAGKPVDAALALNGRSVRFALHSEAPPRKLVVDPGADVFRLLDPSEVPPIVNGLKGSENLLVVAARGVDPETVAAAKVLLASLGKEGTPVEREEETPPGKLRGRDAIFVGAPAGRGYLPPLPPGMELAPRAFLLGGVRHEDPSDALFAVLPNPAAKGRVCAVFLPLSGRAAALAAPKITHYGKYSYLAFRGGTNRDKGTWPPGASPTVVVFPAEAK